jgi:hypothetical protein
MIKDNQTGYTGCSGYFKKKEKIFYILLILSERKENLLYLVNPVNPVREVFILLFVLIRGSIILSKNWRAYV